MGSHQFTWDSTFGNRKVNMECDLDESSPVDLNKSFYVDSDLDLDLMQAEDPVLEDTFIDMKSLSLSFKNEKNEEKVLSKTVIPCFPSEKLLFETSDKSFRREPMRKSKSTGSLKGVSKIQRRKKRARKSLPRPKHFTKTSNSKVAMNVSLSEHSKNNKGIRTFTENIEKSCLCQNCSKYFPKKYLSRHLFLSSCNISKM